MILKRQSDGGFVVWSRSDGRIELTEGEAALLSSEIRKALRGRQRTRTRELNIKIREMLAAGMKQVDVAEALGLSQAYTNQVATGRRGELSGGVRVCWEPERIQELRDFGAQGLTRLEIAQKFAGSSVAAIESAIDRFKVSVRRDRPGRKPANAAQ